MAQNVQKQKSVCTLTAFLPDNLNKKNYVVGLEKSAPSVRFPNMLFRISFVVKAHTQCVFPHKLFRYFMFGKGAHSLRFPACRLHKILSGNATNIAHFSALDVLYCILAVLSWLTCSGTC